MKKVLFVFLLFMVGLLPSIVSAASIKSVTASGDNEIIVGKDYTLTVDIKFDGISKSDVNSKGILIVAFDFEYDPNEIGVIELKSKSTAFKNIFTKEDGQFIVMSAWEKVDPLNTCSDGILVCSDYQLQMFLQSYDSVVGKNATIKINEVEVMLIDQINENTDLNNLDQTATTISYAPNIVKNMMVKKAETAVPIQPVTTMPTTQMPKTNKIQITTTKKILSSNNNLKSLSIDGYQIAFNKNTKEYGINIPDNVNSLTINAVPDNSKAKINIIGNNDLKANNDSVIIEVTSESGVKNNYIIRVNRQTTTTTTNSEVAKEEKEKEKEKAEKKKLTKIAIIVVPIIVVIIIIGSVISIIRRIKINKQINKFL